MIEEHGSLAEKFIKKGFWLYLFSFIIGPIGYIIKIIISGELTVSEVGILYGVISLITLVSAYNDLGLTDSLNFFVPKFITEKRYDKVKSILTYAFIAQMTTGISIALFFFFGSEYIANNYFESQSAIDVLKIFAFFFLGINIFQIMSTFFMVVQNTFYNKIIELLRMLFILFFVVGVFFLDIGNLANYSYAWVFGLYIGIIIAASIFTKKYYNVYLKNEKILWDKTLFKQIFKYALTIFISMQASVILSQMDMQMIIYILGTESAGYYTTYLSIINIPFMLIGPIFALLYPMFSQMHSRGETEKIKIIKSIFQKNFLVLSLSFSILFFVFAKNLAYMFFGERFLPSGDILKYAILFLAFNFLLQMNSSILASIGKVKQRLKIVFIAIVFNFFTNIIFINTIGVSGAALATGMGWILIWILGEYYLGKDYKIIFDYRYLFKNIIVLSSIGTITYFYILPFFEDISRLNTLIFFCLFSILYFLIFAILNKSDFVYLVHEVKKLKKQKN
ncbi:MAG: oligosaccharide flippase family protein [Candidatus Gracilibacteria bacterium]|nr:oligosaccharide flippase family protein [Candidatus Gracilibacteria bacterium]